MTIQLVEFALSITGEVAAKCPICDKWAALSRIGRCMKFGVIACHNHADVTCDCCSSNPSPVINPPIPVK